MFLRLVFASFLVLRLSIGDSVFTLRIGVRCVGSAGGLSPPRLWESQLCVYCKGCVSPPGFVDNNVGCSCPVSVFKRTRRGRTANGHSCSKRVVQLSTSDRVAR